MLRPILLAAAALAAPAHAQDTIPAALPFGTPGAEVADHLEAREMRVMARGGGRDVHAASADRRVQAVAVLAADSLVGLIFYHPETPSSEARAVFDRASSGAERRHGPPSCRSAGYALWTLEDGVLEVRLRGPAGDGAPGAEVRYLGHGYPAEIARRDAARRLARAAAAPRAPAPTRVSGRPRLLGVAADSVRPAPVDPPAGDEAPGAVEAPAAPRPSLATSCG